jgi:hypothetical protein
MVSSFFLWFFYCLSALAICWLPGEFLLIALSIKVSQPFTRLFFKLLAGMTVVGCLTALFATRGITVLSGCLIPLISWLFWHRRKLFQAVKFTWQPWLFAVTSVLIVLIFCMRFYQHNGFGSSFSAPNADYVFNAKMSYYLLEYGIETTLPEYIYPQPGTATPYHYYELWLNAGLCRLLNNNALLNLMLVVFSLGVFTICIGYCALAEQMNLTYRLIFIPALLFTFLTGLYLDVFNENNFLLVSGTFARNVWNCPKLFSVYFFLISSALLFLRKQKTSALLILIFLPIAYITTAPAVLVSVVLFSLVDYLFYTKDKRLFIFTLIPAVLTGIFLLIFYKLTAPADAIPVGISLLKEWIKPTYWKTFINVCGGTTLHFAILYGLSLSVPLVLLRKKIIPWFQQENLSVLILLLPVNALLAWAFLHKAVDSVQVLANFAPPFLSVLLWMLWLRVWDFHRRWAAWIALILTANIWRSVGEMHPDIPSEPFLSQISPYLSEPKGGYMKDASEYAGVFSKNPVVAMPGQSLSLLGNGFDTISLSVFDVPLDPQSPTYTAEKNMIEKSSFYRFVSRQKRENKFRSIPASRLDFIETYHIRYLITTPKVIPDSLLIKRLTKKIVNPLNGEVLWILGSK